jgi:hypothetical protein
MPNICKGILEAGLLQKLPTILQSEAFIVERAGLLFGEAPPNPHSFAPVATAKGHD